MSTRRSSGFRSRSISALLTAIGLTIFTGLALTFYGKAYDATTQFGPTDQAMRRILNSGNEEASQKPTLTNDARADEARRIAFGAENPNTVNGAVILLSQAGALRQALAPDLPNSPNGPNFDVVAAAVREKINELEPGINIQTWEAPKDDPDNPITLIESQTGIPVGLWADFIYLDQKMSYFNVSRDFLRPERMEDTRASLARKVEASIPSARDIVLNVRHRDPRVAEVLANAITAYFKYQYDSQYLQASRKQVQFYQKRRAVAAHRYNATCRALEAFQKQHIGAYRPNDVDEMRYQFSFNVEAAALSEANRKVWRAEEELAKTDEAGALQVAYWAGEPPGTRSHPESPALEGTTKRNNTLLFVVFLLGFIGSLGAYSALASFTRGVSEARDKAAEASQEEPLEAAADDKTF